MSDSCRRDNVDYLIQHYEQPSWRRPDRLWSGYCRWRNVLQSSSAELVHANDVMTARSVAIAARRLKIPLVCHVRFPPSPELVRWAFRTVPKPDAFIFNSQAMQDECGPEFEITCPQSQQFVIHNAVDLEQFTPRPKTSGRPRVGILANLLPVKGHRDFLNMAKLLTDRGVDADYWLIGDDIHETGYRKELKDLTRHLGLEESVQFLGHRSDVPDLLNELDVLVCASHVEPFGRCLIEGMACERPVVATRVGGIPEVVDDEVNGILVSPHKPPELADAVELLLNDTNKARQLGCEGRKRAVALFTPQAHVEQVLHVYDAVFGMKSNATKVASLSTHNA